MDDNFIPHGQRCEADDGRGPDFGRCDERAEDTVTHYNRKRYVCAFHKKHYVAPGSTGAATPQESK